MARLPRFVIPGQSQHIIQHGNNRQNIFKEEADYLFYMEMLTDTANKHQCDIHAYVLMTKIDSERYIYIRVFRNVCTQPIT